MTKIPNTHVKIIYGGSIAVFTIILLFRMFFTESSYPFFAFVQLIDFAFIMPTTSLVGGAAISRANKHNKWLYPLLMGAYSLIIYYIISGRFNLEWIFVALVPALIGLGMGCFVRVMSNKATGLVVVFIFIGICFTACNSDEGQISQEIPPSGSVPIEDLTLPERFVNLIPNLSLASFYTDNTWINIDGDFSAKGNNEKVSFYLFHDIDSDEPPRYFAFFESDIGIKHTEFSEHNPLGIVDISVCDLTGDGFDEVIIKQYGKGTSGTVPHFSLYILTGNTPSILFQYDSGNPSSSYDFGYAGIVNNDKTAVIYNRNIETKATLDLSGYTYRSNSNEYTCEEFEFIILQYLDISDVNEMQNEIILTGEVWLRHHVGFSYINDSIAKIETILSFDVVNNEFVITGVEISSH